MRRNATKFETFWGITLGSNVVYMNSGDSMPQINGSETYTPEGASNVTIDGACHDLFDPGQVNFGGVLFRVNLLDCTTLARIRSSS